jgi:putative peptidoglycan lipid II flippase
MVRGHRHPLVSGAGITGLGTLACRVLGMVRDMATASLLGMSGGGVMDAFVVAFRIPNLFRRLFGEGALAASYVPVLARRLEQDRAAAWQVASAVFTWLSVLLAGILVAAEAICGLVWLAWGDAPGMALLVGLTAAMMPYMLFICLAAQVAATLQCLSEFRVPALAPTLLNICWLVAAWVVAPWFAGDKQAQAYVIAVAVLVAGTMQLAVQWPKLRALGFRFDYRWDASRQDVFEIVRAILPMLLGLAITQINTLSDSLIAWGLSATPERGERIAWLGSAVAYPMQQGAAGSIYYGERIYEFPLGILGIAVATAIFPLLSRHAARGEHQKLGADLTLGLRLVLLFGLPASVGLTILAEPLARLLFERGAFTPADTARAARMIACYSAGVWAFCAVPVVVRGYYALGDRLTPVKIGAGVVALNFSLNLILIWPLAEAGLAVATSVAGMVQATLLVGGLSRRGTALGWPLVAATALRTVAATAVMTAAGLAALAAIEPGPGLIGKLARVAVPLGASVAVYFAAHALLGGRDLRLALGHAVEEPA